MKKTAEKNRDTSSKNILLRTSYKVFKKAVKYSFYIAILYFVYQGFMDWK
ncbi:MAG: hypothetical protein J7574_09835 [Flavobacterium sp.]|nr:hypothetical protein [Flavobacterium sp.]MBO9584445.1 hypothetical protein [Flavobacterium sp.]